ncbi:MAG: hypothetical protein KA383_16485 [Phycisphaerae bacterium]|nr:hypothetical protein [Phycisphaerae bacterium]
MLKALARRARTAWRTVLAAAALLPARAPADTLLASYEQADVGHLVVTSPDAGLTPTWPLCGTTDPAATAGTCLLKLQWANEDDKVEVRHDWSDGHTFDLPGIVAGVAEIRADVYVASPGALPQVLGIWDDVFGWSEGWPAPTALNTWTTISMYVGDLRDSNNDAYTDLDHIYAVLFEDLPANHGTLYIDNLRLAPARTLAFAGRAWSVKHAAHVGPGWNYFSADPEIVWVAPEGLHLRIAHRDGRWLCSEVVGHDSPGYGLYVFTIDTCVAELDPRIVLGLFTWDTYAAAALPGQDQEIDVEFSRWGDPAKVNAQYVVQPWDQPGNLYRFEVDCVGPTQRTTHTFDWQPDRISFASYYGDFALVPAEEDVIQRWCYTGGDIPVPDGETVRMNLWLNNPAGPLDGQDAEVVIADFHYAPSAYAVLINCLTGPSVPAAPDCAAADTEGDTDVDVHDLAALQTNFPG